METKLTMMMGVLMTEAITDNDEYDNGYDDDDENDDDADVSFMTTR